MRHLFGGPCRTRCNVGQAGGDRQEVFNAMTHLACQQLTTFFRLFTACNIDEDPKHNSFDYAGVVALSASRNPFEFIAYHNAKIDFIGTDNSARGIKCRANTVPIRRVNVRREIFGARAHFETTNRKRYNGLTPDARETSAGTLLRDDNDIGTHAYSAYFQNVFRVGDIRITPGVRAERIETTNRARTANFVAIDRSSASAQTLMLPGVGLTWTPDDTLTAFAGIHKGFAPPRPDRDLNPTAPLNAVRPERSTETEVGIRYRPRPGVTVESTLFEMDLSELIVEGSLVGGRSGTFVNAGKARHRGLEGTVSAAIGPFQLGLTYSYLFEAQFLTDVEEVARGVKGNRIPYAPKQFIDASVGYQHPRGIGVELGVNYVGEQFANASNTRMASPDGLNGTIPARTIVRASANYRVPKSRLQLFATVENFFDNAYIASRVDGLFAGPRRQMLVGVRIVP